MHNIGVAGCGRMGLPMLLALRDAGFNATGFDIRPASSYGASQNALETNAEKFAAPLNVLFTVVRDTPQTEAVLFTRQSILAKAPNLTHLVICSTLSPNYVHELRRRIPEKVCLIDAPMSGAAIGAQEKRLSFMIGADDTALRPVLPMIKAMGAHIHRMGPLGAGMSAKVLNNLVAASSTASTRLALDWAAQQGVDQRKFLNLMRVSSGQTWFGSGFDEIEFARDGFEDGNTIAILKKDVESALDAAPKGAETDLPNAIIKAIRNLQKLD